jgi:hypothetical protein
MCDLDSAFSPLGASDPDTLLGLASAALPALSCTVSSLNSSGNAILGLLEYRPSDAGWKFAEVCPSWEPIALRNAVFHAGEPFEVRSLSTPPIHIHTRGVLFSALLMSRNVANLGHDCIRGSSALQVVAFESDSHLQAIGYGAFSICPLLRSIAIPSLVCSLGRHCFHFCRSLHSVLFEPPSRLTMIESGAFSDCGSLNRFVIPASVTAIDRAVFSCSGIRSIEIEEGSVSFRVVNELLVDFDIRSLVSVIGSPESIQIPSSIEELRPHCCGWKQALRTVEFAADSQLRLIGESAFAFCTSLTSICMPSSLEVISKSSFRTDTSLQTVTFPADSKLRLIERGAFEHCESVELVSVPASAEVIC